MASLLYPELSYKILGLCYEVYNGIGYGYQEKYYQRGFAVLLDRKKIPYKKEQKQVIRFGTGIIGRYYIDFVIDDKLVIEFKVADQFYNVHLNQVLGYLKATKLRLGILILISQEGIKQRRVVN